MVSWSADLGQAHHGATPDAATEASNFTYRLELLILASRDGRLFRGILGRKLQGDMTAGPI